MLRSGSEVLGGPVGTRAGRGPRWWSAVPVLLGLAVLTMALGVLERGYCRDIAWTRADGQQFAHACYSDIPHLYRERGFAAGATPYLDSGEWPALEYPVLTGGLMWVTAELTGLGGGDVDARAVRYYDLNAVALLLAGLIVVLATIRLAGRARPWDAALVAASPLLILHATINWDLFAVALAMLALLAWSRWRPGWAGVLLGLAAAAKLYPLLLLIPIAALCLRSRRWRPLLLTVGAAVATWLAVNLPVLLAAPEGWWAFYEFNAERGADFGSVWYLLEQSGHGVAALDVVTTALLLAALTAIAVLAWCAPTPPRLMQLAFLAVAAFVLVNKVWSPQYALWLLPLAALARPRWRDVGIWQAGEVVYFFGVWFYLLGGYDRGLPLDAYGVMVGLRAAALLWLVAVVVRDIWRPQHDPVRMHLGPRADPGAGWAGGPPTGTGPRVGQAVSA